MVWLRVLEFVSPEISQTLRDLLEYINRSNTFCTNLNAQIILARYGSPKRHRTRRSRKNWDISEDMHPALRCLHWISPVSHRIEIRQILLLFSSPFFFPLPRSMLFPSFFSLSPLLSPSSVWGEGASLTSVVRFLAVQAPLTVRLEIRVLKLVPTTRVQSSYG